MLDVIVKVQIQYAVNPLMPDNDYKAKCGCIAVIMEGPEERGMSPIPISWLKYHCISTQVL